jgi:hypothetical protein
MEVRKRALGLIDDGDIKAKMRADIRRKWRVERSKTSKQLYFIRIFIYLLFIGFALYFILFTDFINKLVSYFLQ